LLLAAADFQVPPDYRMQGGQTPPRRVRHHQLPLLTLLW
jgi:hypothetical protein